MLINAYMSSFQFFWVSESVEAAVTKYHWPRGLLFSCSAVSSSLRPHGLQHARLPCPSLSPGFAQTHIHWVGDAIWPSHPLSSPSPAFNLSQHQGLFQWVSSLHQVAKVLEFQLQHQSFQWIFKVNFLYDLLVWSPWSPGDSQESSTPQFKSISSSVLNFLYGATLTSIHAAAAKSLQSCPTLCIPRDSGPPGSTVPGILQAR